MYPAATSTRAFARRSNQTQPRNPVRKQGSCESGERVDSMRYLSVAPLAAAAFAASARRPAFADQGMRVSGPHAHENLAVYFVHGASAAGAVPLTLQEALAKGSVQVIETGHVNELQIENTGAEQVFVQAGDIVKGGKQDRVLTVSFLLPAKSGACRSPRSASSRAAGRRAARRISPSSRARTRRCRRWRRCWPWRPRRLSRPGEAGRRADHGSARAQVLATTR